MLRRALANLRVLVSQLTTLPIALSSIMKAPALIFSNAAVLMIDWATIGSSRHVTAAIIDVWLSRA
jgi:hypothetical protein